MLHVSPLPGFCARAKLASAFFTVLALFSVSGYCQSGVLTYDNGPFINRPGQGPDGSDGSVLQNGMGVIGWPAVQGHQARVADDFTVPSGQSWPVSRIRFFSYFPVAPTNSSYAGVTLQVWDGQPGTEGAQVVWGNNSSNILTGSSFAGAYRYRDGAPDTLRPVFWVDAAINAVFAPGTYWLDWAFDGPPDVFGEPHQMPITIDGQQATGNALWVGGPAIDVQPQGFPFQVFTNRPPTAAAGQDQTVECGAPVTLDGSGSTDPDNDALTFTWWEGSNQLGAGESVEVDLPSGSHAIRLVVTDPGGASSEDTTIVTVRDTSPPVISRVQATPNVLWPPNRQMVPVRLTVNASDQCDSTIAVRITRVTTSERVGPFSRDWEITGPLSLKLRAARQGGSERVYTIFLEAVDSQKNKATASVRVVVPKSQSKHLESTRRLGVFRSTKTR